MFIVIETKKLKEFDTKKKCEEWIKTYCNNKCEYLNLTTDDRVLFAPSGDGKRITYEVEQGGFYVPLENIIEYKIKRVD